MKKGAKELCAEFEAEDLKVDRVKGVRKWTPKSRRKPAQYILDNIVRTDTVQSKGVDVNQLKMFPNG